MNLSDFIIVRGRNQTEALYMGDLERIDLSADLIVRREDTRLMGIDVAWLQEAVAERDHLVGRTYDVSVSAVGTFDRRLRGDPIAFMVEAVGDYLEGFCFVWSTDFVDWTELSADAPTVRWLEEIAEREGKRITSLAIPVPAYDRIIRAVRIFALQRAMQELAYAIVSVGYPGNVSSETVETSGTFDEFDSDVVSIIGTRVVYREGACAQKSDGKWKEMRRVTRTASLGALDSLAVSLPGQRYNGRLLTKAVTTWVAVTVTYMTYGGKSSSPVSRRFAVKVGRSLYSPDGIRKDTVRNIINGVKSRCSFNMDPATLDHNETTTAAEAHMSIELGRAEAVCEFRDAVTDV